MERIERAESQERQGVAADCSDGFSGCVAHRDGDGKPEQDDESVDILALRLGGRFGRRGRLGEHQLQHGLTHHEHHELREPVDGKLNVYRHARHLARQVVARNEQHALDAPVSAQLGPDGAEPEQQCGDHVRQTVDLQPRPGDHICAEPDDEYTKLVDQHGGGVAARRLVEGAHGDLEVAHAPEAHRERRVEVKVEEHVAVVVKVIEWQDSTRRKDDEQIAEQVERLVHPVSRGEARP
eukprot:3026668-Prymnesium_polylepis.1